MLIFLGGGACGAAIASAVIIRSIHQALHDPGEAAAHFTRRLTSQLNLTEAQSRQVREILVRRHHALADLRREVQPRLEVELSVLEEEIAAVLDDDQRAKWRAHAARFRSHWLPPIPESAPAQ